MAAVTDDGLVGRADGALSKFAFDASGRLNVTFVFEGDDVDLMLDLVRCYHQLLKVTVEIASRAREHVPVAVDKPVWSGDIWEFGDDEDTT